MFHAHTHTSRYASGRSIALTYTRHATLVDVLLMLDLNLFKELVTCSWGYQGGWWVEVKNYLGVGVSTIVSMMWLGCWQYTAQNLRKNGQNLNRPAILKKMHFVCRRCWKHYMSTFETVVFTACWRTDDEFESVFWDRTLGLPDKRNSFCSLTIAVNCACVKLKRPGTLARF